MSDSAMSDGVTTDPTAQTAGTATPTGAPASLDEALGAPGALIDEIAADLAGPAGVVGGADTLAEPISPVVLAELDDDATEPMTMRDMRLLADIDVEVTVEFGRARLALRELLSLRRGSLVELSRTLDQPVSVLANDTLVAYGEIVMVGDRFGVHVLEIVDPADRAKPRRVPRSSPVSIDEQDWAVETPPEPDGDDAADAGDEGGA